MNMPDDLAARAEQARRAVPARRKAEAARISHGRDDWNQSIDQIGQLSYDLTPLLNPQPYPERDAVGKVH